MDIVQLLAIARVKPDKKLDQYFLKEDSIIEEEIGYAELAPEDTVLEVGAGIGNLTIHLSKKSKVIAIEKDFSFSRLLRGIPNTNAIMGNALEVLESLRGSNKFNKIVANIPYSISQDLMIEFFRHRWDTAVIMVQKEFAEKLVSEERLGKVMKELADIKIVKNVPAEAFYPKAVKSSILLIKQKKLIDYDFWNFVHALRPNKNVSNQVKKCSPSISKKKVHQLSIGEIKQLYKRNS